MVQLHASLFAGINAMLISRTNRRVGLLNTAAGGTVGSGPNAATIAASGFSEVSEVQTLYNALNYFRSDLAKLSPTDSAGNVQLGALANTAGLGGAGLNAIGNALVAFNATYQALELETLPG